MATTTSHSPRPNDDAEKKSTNYQAQQTPRSSASCNRPRRVIVTP